MTVQRIVFGAVLAGVASAFVAPPAAAQMPGLTAGPPPSSFGTGAATGLAPQAGGVGVAPTLFAPNPTQTLTGMPALPPGTVPGLLNNANCCGPVGANGPIAYEVYAHTGPNFIIGGGSEFSGAAGFGWRVGGGGRTLFLNPAADAAWVAGAGINYIYNGADESRVFDVFARRPRDQNNMLLGPDQLQPFYLRGVTRAGVTYAVGRDWFLNGPAVTGGDTGWNSRVGVDIGGRYETVRVDLVPIAARDSYFRRVGIAHTLTVGAHWSTEVPMGAWIGFAGVRAEYGHMWSNVIPPQDGNLQDISVLLTLGVRF